MGKTLNTAIPINQWSSKRYAVIRTLDLILILPTTTLDENRPKVNLGKKRSVAI
jgi:hypothetical protein